ncbi:MAG: SDR family NAD(P)-dependent oxidoreductase [Opitutaceae bacterium]|nr:SDR family NAD(P)-dependent oxidoreductase [Cytophagales bacterium]
MNLSIDTVPSQKGKVAIVTGANNGLGFETTLGLANKDFTIVMACRDIVKAERSREKILAKYPMADVQIMELDLSSLKSVSLFASQFVSRFQKLDLLVNNAGIMVPPFSKTADGFESQMGVNYLGHFLLTNLLFPLLKNSPSSRVISLSSIAHKQGKIDFKNLNSQHGYNKMKVYSQSKLACLMFAYELQRRIEQNGLNVKSVAAHPGVSPTNLFQFQSPIVSKILTFLSNSFMHIPAEAAKPSLVAALSTDIRGGDFIGPKGFLEMRGKPGKVKSSSISYDKEIAKQLWEVSEKLTGKSFLM